MGMLKNIFCAGLVSLSMSTASLAENWVKIEIKEGHNFKKMDAKGGEPYVKWKAGKQKGKTRVSSIEGDQTAEWNYEDIVDLDGIEDIYFNVKEKDSALNIWKLMNKGKARSYGTYKLKVSDIDEYDAMQLDLDGKNSYSDDNIKSFITVRFTKANDSEVMRILKKRKS